MDGDQFGPRITEEDILSFAKEYLESDIEKEDLIQNVIQFKGDMKKVITEGSRTPRSCLPGLSASNLEQCHIRQPPIRRHHRQSHLRWSVMLDAGFGDLSLKGMCVLTRATTNGKVKWGRRSASMCRSRRDSKKPSRKRWTNLPSSKRSAPESNLNFHLT